MPNGDKDGLRPRCPKCGWQDVRYSARRGIVDLVLGSLSLYPWRCRTCGTRFHSLSPRIKSKRAAGKGE